MSSEMKGNLIIVSAPSGAGKTTLVSEALRRMNGVRVSVSYTSRAAREGEQHGVHYHFVSADEFRAMIARGEFLEWAEVHGNLYGTGRRAVEEMRADGTDVILVIDVQGAENARKLFPDAIGIFILPPSYQSLVERLECRGANHRDDLELRLRNARHELEHYRNFDYLIVNDELEHATQELMSIIRAERCRCHRRAQSAEQIIETFGRTVAER
ncbi:MAG TPA: guanylate kinase [Blastocatellia bacterium]|nr:guanylate kinase [Blastocatellia bacterium]